MSKPDTAFTALIANPLEALIGRRLSRVGYGILPCDAPDFQVEFPNETGLTFATLEFGEEIFEISWDWANKELRGSHAYCLRLLPAFRVRGNQEGEWNADSFVEVMASDTALWHKALFQPLQAVEVFGFQTSPHLFRFTFASTKICVALGYAGEPLLVGDADELLIFPDDEWRDVQSTSPEEWVKLWEGRMP